MEKVSILFFIILLLNSCKTKNEEQIVTVEDKYSLSIPSFLTKVTNLNSDASLQYQHVWKELYVIVIDESRDEVKKALEENNLTNFYHNDLEGYSELLLDSFKGEISSVHQSVVVDTILNGLPAKLTTLTGKVEGFEVFYSIGFYEGKDRYYQVLSWTTSSNKYLHNSEMEKTLYSLRELKNIDNVQ